MNPELTTGLPTPQGRGQALVDNSYLVAAGLPPRRVSLVEIGSLCYTLLR